MGYFPASPERPHEEVSAVATRQQTQKAPKERPAGGGDSLTVTDNRTGETYEVEITDGTIRALDLRQIKVAEDDFGLMSYDPAFTQHGVVPLARSPTSTATRGSSSTAGSRSSSSASTRPTSRSPTC